MQYFNNRLMHALFHIRTVIIQRDRYRPEGFSPRVDIGWGMITVLIWKKACINLFITYFNIQIKRTKLTSHIHTKLWVIDIGWGMITVLIWKKAWIVLFIKRLDIMLSEFCPDICLWDDIAVALWCLRMGKIDVITYTIILCCPCYMPKYVPRLEGIMHDPKGRLEVIMCTTRRGVHYAF